MKIALCFIINYEHILHKEEIWKKWVEPNKDLINVYFYYSNFKKIKSPWILKHTIPPNYIHETTYYHVIPAYLSVAKFALTHDANNQWFCFLTDSCCPIISPTRFRYLFYTYYNRSIMSWKKAWWNIDFHKRANLALLPEELRLANDPWFVMKREDILNCLHFVNTQQKLSHIICGGGLANESIFAIILNVYKQLNKTICAVTHMTDWTRRSSTTSPHLFKDSNKLDIEFIEKNLNENKYVMFIRKISPVFPDEVLENYIYNYSKQKDALLILRDPFLLKKIYYWIISNANVYNFIGIITMVSLWYYYSNNIL